MGIIFWLSSRPKPPFSWLADSVDWGDKLGHALIYAVLGALLWPAYSNVRQRAKRIVRVLAAAAAYGLVDEIHQLFVPGRSFDLVDLAADAVGAGIGAALMSLVLRGDKDG